MITIYSSEDCPRCKQLSKWFVATQIPHEEKPFSAELRANLLLAGIFSLELPILQVGGYYYIPAEMFVNGNLNTEKLNKIFQREA